MIEPPGHTWRGLMDLALAQAMAAGQEGEVPVGAVLVSAEGRLLGAARNRTITDHDASAHAEILCLRQAGRLVGNHRLAGSILAVTLEPCLMCVGALIQARVAGVVFGAADPKAGALVSRLTPTDYAYANHAFAVLGGVLAEECGGLISRFFAARRKERRGGRE
jgi:tRNA(adenine34) deaminase